MNEVAGGNYYDGCKASIEQGVEELHRHVRNGCDVIHYENQVRLTFGWKCLTCSEGIYFRLMPFKKAGCGSRWREEMTTTKGRETLIWSVHGCLIPITEERLS